MTSFARFLRYCSACVLLVVCLAGCGQAGTPAVSPSQTVILPTLSTVPTTLSTHTPTNILTTPIIATIGVSSTPPAITSPSLASTPVPLDPGQYIFYAKDNRVVFAISVGGFVNGPLLSFPNTSLADISPDGEWVASFNKGGDHDILRVIGLQTHILSTYSLSGLVGCGDLSWSPDGTRLALSCGHIYIFSLDGEQLTQLTTWTEGGFGYVAWSPDGKWIAYNNVADPYGQDAADGIYLRLFR